MQGWGELHSPIFAMLEGTLAFLFNIRVSYAIGACEGEIALAMAEPLLISKRGSLMLHELFHRGRELFGRDTSTMRCISSSGRGLYRKCGMCYLMGIVGGFFRPLNKLGFRRGNAVDYGKRAWCYCGVVIVVAGMLACSGGLGTATAGEPESGDGEDPPPCRAITSGPEFHWFGYYDKLEFDPSGRYVLGMEVDFEHRSPRPDDVIQIGMVDLEENDKWIELGESQAWGWQQGCMLQWRPGSRSEVLWNDREGDRFVCHILDVFTREKRTIPHPVYTVSPDGKNAWAPDFRRIHDTRQSYGYAGLPDPYADEPAPEESGIFRVDLESGERELIVSLADVLAIPYEGGELSGMKHWFNHLLINPDGTRLEFLHRWQPPGGRGISGTRMFTCDVDGDNLYVLDPHGRTSHFIWRDPRHLLAWSWHPDLGSGFILYTDQSREVELVGEGVMNKNGHVSYLPDTDWILNDTYPDRRRRQHPYLYHVPSRKRFGLGHFRSPPEYRGGWRCDTHPRFSPDGSKVVIDSPHGGDGRQLYLIDISELVESPPEGEPRRRTEKP